MASASHIKLAPCSRADETKKADVSGTRFRVLVTNRGDRASTIRVYDRVRKCVFLRWRSDEARRIIATGILPQQQLVEGGMDCDKAMVLRLALIGSSVTNEIEQRERRARRYLKNHEVDLLHYKLTSIFFDHKGHHFADSEITCLVMLRHPWITTGEIRQALDELVRWNVVQRITVDDGLIFYDTDMRPHLHTYDPRTRELHDAPASGVVRVS